MIQFTLCPYMGCEGDLHDPVHSMSLCLLAKQETSLCRFEQRTIRVHSTEGTQCSPLECYMHISRYGSTAVACFDHIAAFKVLYLINKGGPLTYCIEASHIEAQ